MPGASVAVRGAASTSIIATPITRSWRLLELFGALYVVGSIGLGIASLALIYPTLENDFFWVRFLSNDISSALKHALNTQLSLLTNNASRTIDLLDPSSGYAASDVVGVHPAYARFIMYQELASLRGGIMGLRNLQLAAVENIGAQYCWVDLASALGHGVHAAAARALPRPLRQKRRRVHGDNPAQH